MSSVFIGFDGFVDHLYHVVKERDGRQTYIPYTTLREFGSVLEQASSKSCNIESVLLSSSLGGNAPLIALGLGSLGKPSHLVGCLGTPTLHPAFATLPQKNIKCTSIGSPGTTFAYEFFDGKLLLGTMNDVLSLSFKECFNRFPLFVQSIEESSLFVTVNWTMSPLVSEFWHWLNQLPTEKLQNKQLFIDLCDPKKRTQNDIKEAIDTILRLSQKMSCFLSMNAGEAEALIRTLHLDRKDSLEGMIEVLSYALPNVNLYIHTSRKVVAINSSLQTEMLEVPHTPTPHRLTGAGDMFNAGVLSSLIDNQGLRHQLLRGIACSGIWVRKGQAASLEEVLMFEELYTHSFNAINEAFSPA